jgi:hypothetical protein
MKKHWIAFVFGVFFSLPLIAQDFPRAEIYAGYQLLQTDNSIIESSFGSFMNGFMAAAEFNAKSWLGFVGEFGYAKKSYINMGAESRYRPWTILAGPRLSYRGKARLFGHALFGIEHESAVYENLPYFSQTVSENNFAMDLGGGLDISLGNRASFRPFQVDMLASESQSGKFHNKFRYSIGILFKLGKSSK